MVKVFLDDAEGLNEHTLRYGENKELRNPGYNLGLLKRGQ